MSPSRPLFRFAIAVAFGDSLELEPHVGIAGAPLRTAIEAGRPPLPVLEVGVDAPMIASCGGRERLQHDGLHLRRVGLGQERHDATAAGVSTASPCVASSLYL